MNRLAWSLVALAAFFVVAFAAESARRNFGNPRGTHGTADAAAAGAGSAASAASSAPSPASPSP